MSGLYVQYGGHTDCPEGWLNFEQSPYLKASRIPILGKILRPRLPFDFPDEIKSGNIIEGLPISANSVDGIFCSHVLEHLTYMDCLAAISNTHKYLKPGGIFRFVLPDMLSRCQYYVDQHNNLQEPARWLMDRTMLGEHSPRKTSLASVLKNMLSNSNHMWMWDERSLTKVLTEAGFVEVRRTEFGDCSDKMFNNVESEQRYFWSSIPNDAASQSFPELSIECRKAS